jgi:hypothetical protein
MAIAETQALIASGGKAKKGVVPMVNRLNGFSVVGSHDLACYLWMPDITVRGTICQMSDLLKEE